MAAQVPEGVKLARVGGYYGFVGMVAPNSKLDRITGEMIIRKVAGTGSEESERCCLVWALSCPFIFQNASNGP